MNETVVFPNHHADHAATAVSDSGCPSASAPGGRDHQQPGGSSDMPTMPAPQGRYTYGSGARPLDGYTIKRAIGRGGFGEVYYATSDSGKEVALKLILRNLEVERRGVVQCMNLKCPNLLAVFDIKPNDSGDTFVIMEYVAGPSLAQVLARHPEGLPPAEARAWMRGLVDGVAYLHDHGIVHRDLKPANLFMEEGIVKIGDYGLAKLITPSQGTEHSESIGTCHYMAPEIASGKYHKPIDVYAIGVILFEMLTGRVPFEGETVGEVLMKHLTARPDVSKLAEPYRSIVARALAKDPAQRPSSLYDLLPPDDAPRQPGVRFIGDGKTSPPLPDAAAQDDVLHIPAEEPVFYIGPDTRPPLGQRLRAAWQGRRPAPQPNRPAPPRPRAPQPQPRPQQPPRPQATRRPLFAARVKPAPAVVPIVVPPPPPLPAPRVRVAELASAMLWAAPAAAALSVIAGAMLGVDMTRHPEHVAYLFAASLLASWGIMVPAKAFEGRTVPTNVRRATHLAAGGLVGLSLWTLTSWLGLGPLWSWDSQVAEALRDVAGPDVAPNALGYAGYFGGLFLLAGLPRLAARDRSKRVRIWSVGRTAALAGLLGLLWPSPQPWELTATAVAAIVVQAVAPWSEPAARYAKYAARMANQNGGRKVA